MHHTILHVEDEPILAEFVRASFTRLGFDGTLLAANRVADAFALIDEQVRDGRSLDLILVDMQLPDGTGMDVIRRVKGDPALASIPTLVLSGDVDPATVSEAYTLGANCYVAKFPEVGDVFTAIEAMYHCWLESAVLPEPSPARRGAEILPRAIRLRARTSQLYTALARSASDDSDAVQFWLGLALNEGNHANLLAFFENQVVAAEVPDQLLERLARAQRRREEALARTEQLVRETATPSREAVYRWILEMEADLDDAALTEALDILMCKGPEVTRALRDRFTEHLLALARRIAGDTSDPGLLAGARELSARAERLRSAPLSATGCG